MSHLWSMFTPIRSLLNPHFEGYKLDVSHSPQLVQIPLSHPATQSRGGSRALGFQEVASRVRHNHLAVATDGSSAVYVAEDGNVVLIRVDVGEGETQAEGGVSICAMFRLPTQASNSKHEWTEYPAAAHITRDTWLVSDGHGRAYLLSASDSTAARLLGSWELRMGDAIASTPFQLHNAAHVAPNLALAVLSSSTPSTHASSSKDKVQPTFDVFAVRIPLAEPFEELPSPHGGPPAFEIAWHRRGTHIPLFTSYIAARDAFLLLGGSPYHDVISAASPAYEPSQDELAPIPRAGENLDSTQTRPPPYSWTQTDEAVTLIFALPGMTLTSSIHVTFEARTLSLHAGAPPLPQAHYAGAPLWDAIHPTSSLWTWERGNSTTAGLLTLHLDKANPGTRWSHVFVQGFETHEVVETLDPSTLADIRDSLEKYTAALQDGSGLGHGVPSLAEGERDNEVDASIGNPVVLTWVPNDGTAGPPANDALAVSLSLPLPGAQDPLSLVIKNDIDGPLYTWDDAALGWTHTATYPALAFVLASKRDTRFTFHAAASAAFAFESGAREGGGGNVYVYRGCGSSDKCAKQSVFQLQPDAGTLLGVGAVTSKTGHATLLCLSERTLTGCRGLF